MKNFSNWVPAFRRFFETILCVAVATALAPYANVKIHQIGKPEFFATSIWYKWYTLLVVAMSRLLSCDFSFFTAQETILIATG